MQRRDLGPEAGDRIVRSRRGEVRQFGDRIEPAGQRVEPFFEALEGGGLGGGLRALVERGADRGDLLFEPEQRDRIRALGETVDLASEQADIALDPGQVDHGQGSRSELLDRHAEIGDAAVT